MKQKVALNRASVQTGDTFTATINGVRTTGIVHRARGGIYLCQQDVPGAGCANKHGYKHSYFLPYSNDGKGRLVIEKKTKFGVSSLCVSRGQDTTVKNYANNAQRIAALEKELVAAKAEQAAKEAKIMPAYFKGWRITYDNSNHKYVIGCGAVSLSVGELKAVEDTFHQLLSRTSYLPAADRIAYITDAYNVASKIVKLHKPK